MRVESASCRLKWTSYWFFLDFSWFHLLLNAKSLTNMEVDKHSSKADQLKLIIRAEQADHPSCRRTFMEQTSQRKSLWLPWQFCNKPHRIRCSLLGPVFRLMAVISSVRCSFECMKEYYSIFSRIHTFSDFSEFFIVVCAVWVVYFHGSPCTILFLLPNFHIKYTFFTQEHYSHARK